MLDTNTVSSALQSRKNIVENMTASRSALCVSAVTEGEILYGLSRRPEATKLRRTAQELMTRLEIMPWPAAQAIETGAVLATSDLAFGDFGGLQLVDWSLA
jgi:tRNA(fMet)-specific endonuclease VapC